MASHWQNSLMTFMKCKKAGPLPLFVNKFSAIAIEITVA